MIRRVSCDDFLGDAFARAHDRRGANGFVGGDVDEIFRAGVERGVDDVLRAEDVVGDRFDDVVFHERHVFVCGGVEDCARVVLREDCAEAAGVADVGDDGGEFQADELISQFAADFEYLVFAVIENDELRRLEGRDLAAEFAANGATGAGDEDDATLDDGAHCREVGGDRVAAEKVFDFYAAECLDADFARDEVAEPGDDSRFDAGAYERLNDSANDRPTHRGDRDDHFIDIVAADKRREIRQRTEHGKSTQQLPLLV